jgi:hypothetical protein
MFCLCSQVLANLHNWYIINMKAGHTYLWFFFLSCLSSSSYLYAQEDPGRFDPVKCARLESGFVLGGAVSIHNFTLHPGCNFQYSYCLKTGEKFGAGAGGGIQFFHQQGFIPFYFDIVSFLSSNKNSAFIACQAGYAFGWSKEFKDRQEAMFKGGLYLGAGVGYKFNFYESFSGYISLSYRHQMASVSYIAESNEEQTDRLNYGMLGLNIGVMLEQR